MVGIIAAPTPPILLEEMVASCTGASVAGKKNDSETIVPISSGFDSGCDSRWTAVAIVGCAIGVAGGVVVVGGTACGASAIGTGFGVVGIVMGTKTGVGFIIGANVG